MCWHPVTSLTFLTVFLSGEIWESFQEFSNPQFPVLPITAVVILRFLLHGRLKANSHMPCRAAWIHTCHAAPLPFSDSAVSFVKVRVVAGNIRTASPTVYRIGMLLITTFVELRVVAGRSRTRAGRPHAVSGQPMLIHTCHAMPMPRRAVALRNRFQKGMVVAWHVLIKHGRTV
jgi:hypothetical protein